MSQRELEVAMSIAQRDVIACTKRSEGLNVAAWIDEHGLSL